MNCIAANQLYVRADGRVPCNCDVGEHFTLFMPDQADLERSDYVRDCYNGEPFRRMREDFQHGRLFLDACKDCFFYEPSKPFEHYGESGRQRVIRNLQLETSFLCPVECEICVPKKVRTDPKRSPLGDGPTIMPDAVFHKVVDDLVRNKIGVQEFFFCGRGEPLLHPRIGQLIRYARRYFDDSTYSAHTSGNVRFNQGLLELDDVRERCRALVDLLNQRWQEISLERAGEGGVPEGEVH